MLDLATAVTMTCSSHGLEMILQQAIDHHLQFLHRSRQVAVRRMLPRADVILDLGGAHSPLYRMGYPHSFKQLMLVDLPPDERYRDYAHAVVDAPPGAGEVKLHWGDMTRLDQIESDTIDLVWSGQSIEHVDVEAARRMCQAAFRVLRPGGWFCLDTPNRHLTEIHTRDWHGGFINEDHKHEYRLSELRGMLLASGFLIEQEFGICEMPNSYATGTFDYTDFVLGNPVTSNVESAYCLYFGCRKPN
jgi:SAM-dependent methyltransferase